jgi:hypothetical protein
MAEIRYIRGHELDRKRWDLVVRQDPNGNLFGSSAYLDMMTDGWDAIICGDYEALLPLPVRYRWGYQYVHTIPFCGPFAIYGPAASYININAMLDAIPLRFIRCDVNLWTAVPIRSDWEAQSRTNYLLDLSSEYAVIRSRYSASSRNLLNRGLPEGFSIVKDHPIPDQLKMAVKFGGLGKMKVRDTDGFVRLCQKLCDTGETSSLAIVSSDGRMLAGGIFLRSQHQIHYLSGWSSRLGRSMNAARFIIDHVIREYTGQSFILDFEGSDIPGVAQFFSSFGAVAHKYQFLRRDKLPMPVKVFFMLRDVMSAGLTAKARGNEGTLVDQS